MVAPVGAQQAAPPPAPAVDATALAKQSQNPVGSLVSVPFQFNFNTGGDLGERTFLNVNFQPVIPFRLTDRWNVIARTIVPLESVPGEAGTRSPRTGTRLRAIGGQCQLAWALRGRWCSTDGR
jgi:hypothetical protein